MTPDEYIEYAVAEQERDRVPGAIGGSLLRSVLTKYLATPEMRQLLARSKVEPVRLRLMFADGSLKDRGQRGRDGGLIFTHADVVASLRDQVTDLTNFLSVFPPEETNTDPFRQLRSLLGDMRGLKDVAERTSPW